jgi:hypothetical protein
MSIKSPLITVEGQKELDALLKRIPAQAKAQASKELSDIVQDLKGESQRRAPIDLGDLRGSAFGDTKDLEGTVGFTEPYAMYQHEGIGFNHPKGGEAKYLENPFKEKMKMYIKAIGDAIDRAVK